MWRIVAEMTPEQFGDCIDSRYITDALTPEDAVEMLREAETGKAERLRDAENSRAVPAYTTSARGHRPHEAAGRLQTVLHRGADVAR